VVDGRFPPAATSGHDRRMGGEKQKGGVLFFQKLKARTSKGREESRGFVSGRGKRYEILRPRTERKKRGDRSEVKGEACERLTFGGGRGIPQAKGVASETPRLVTWDKVRREMEKKQLAASSK